MENYCNNMITFGKLRRYKLMKMLLESQEINVISRLLGVSVAAIIQQLECKPVPVFLKESGVSIEAFCKTMDNQSFELVRLATSACIITRWQANKILNMTNQNNGRIGMN